MAHCSENIPFNFPVAPVELLQQPLNFLPLGHCCAGAWIDKVRATFFCRKSSYNIFVNKSKGSNQCKSPLKKRLGGHHRTDLSGVTDIHE